MIGVSKGVSLFLSKLYQKLHLQGSACHLVHIAAQKGCSGRENSREKPQKILKVSIRCCQFYSALIVLEE
ncbi:hypothetical protein PR048_013990 [Dryococelus australis]|uniref:Uncharacterized protein n=1 Tax=Dryococelus australis TaxID=614101 RepID=A0ABQ9HTS5_9NEOP|nr:hypothetical protein PR048_013990 [Dryococelus australis]